MSKAKFSCNEKINFAYCDENANVRISNILAMAQQISEDHCDFLGMGYGYFKEKGKAFLLAKLRLNIARLPRGGELIKINTHAFLPNRAIYTRITDFCDENGEVIASLDSRWTLVDIDSHKICRRLPEDIPLPFDDAEDFKDFRSIRNTNPQHIFDVEVRPHQLDVNSHVNNTVYADMVFDVAYKVLPKNYDVKEFQIYYHNEARLGDIIAIGYEIIDNTLYVEGKIGEKSCFEAVMLIEI